MKENIFILLKILFIAFLFAIMLTVLALIQYIARYNPVLFVCVMFAFVVVVCIFILLSGRKSSEI